MEKQKDTLESRAALMGVEPDEMRKLAIVDFLGMFNTLRAELMETITYIRSCELDNEVAIGFETKPYLEMFEDACLDFQNELVDIELECFNDLLAVKPNLASGK